jgi:hypothetical protein
MMWQYDDLEVVETLSHDLIGIHTSQFGQQLWVAAGTRKTHVCMYCDSEIAKGEEAFRPAKGTEQNRMHRVCRDCINFIVRASMAAFGD